MGMKGKLDRGGNSSTALKQRSFLAVTSCERSSAMPLQELMKAEENLVTVEVLISALKKELEESPDDKELQKLVAESGDVLRKAKEEVERLRLCDKWIKKCETKVSSDFRR